MERPGKRASGPERLTGDELKVTSFITDNRAEIGGRTALGKAIYSSTQDKYKGVTEAGRQVGQEDGRRPVPGSGAGAVPPQAGFQARLDAMAEEEGNGDGVKEVQEPAETDRQID